jgi:hypothetical protein
MAKTAPKKQPNKARNGAENGRWIGGKIKQGPYIKVRKPDSPQADSSGYSYEHREKTNAPKGSQVHHENGKQTDNSAGNLSVKSSLGEHNKERKSDDRPKKDDKKPPAKKKPAKKEKSD